MLSSLSSKLPTHILFPAWIIHTVITVGGHGLTGNFKTVFVVTNPQQTPSIERANVTTVACSKPGMTAYPKALVINDFFKIISVKVSSVLTQQLLFEIFNLPFDLFQTKCLVQVLPLSRFQIPGISLKEDRLISKNILNLLGGSMKILKGRVVTKWRAVGLVLLIKNRKENTLPTSVLNVVLKEELKDRI